TEVKLSSADGSWDLVPVRVGRRQAAKNTSLLTCVFLCFQTVCKKEVMVIQTRCPRMNHII
ncbi:hypothetical protein P4313_17135, partial [Bacillus tropicus]|uniref:hypothetical protein n=1 Tax=Bacillus tropicus TaxID=2026188 RepID=UPI002E1FB57D|nr:hypothetical protein [Bacillus tropicus]